MSVLVVGISHRSAPVALLEQVTAGLVDLADPAGLLGQLGASGPVSEAVLLSTCNRVEVYADSSAFHPGVDAVSDLLARCSGVALEELSRHLYVHWEGQAVLHLFGVAAGLDSMVVGESQILGQLRRAYAAAGAGAGRVLHELFQTALRVGKRAHAETGIDEAGRSLVTIGLDRAALALGGLSGRTALVVGAGSMGALSGATLRRAGIGGLVVLNRTPERARRLAVTLDARAGGLGDLPEALASVDLVVSSTGATGLVLTSQVVRAALARRAGRPLAIIDLALPHDVDPSVRDLPGVHLVDLAALQDQLAGTTTGADVAAARGIVAQEVAAFLAWQQASRVAPTVVALRGRADQVVTAELRRVSRRLPDLDPGVRRELESTVRRVVDKLLHTPTVRVKELTEAPEGLSYADALRELFGLDRDAPAAVGTMALPAEDGDD